MSDDENFGQKNLTAELNKRNAKVGKRSEYKSKFTEIATELESIVNRSNIVYKDILSGNYPERLSLDVSSLNHYVSEEARLIRILENDFRCSLSDRKKFLEKCKTLIGNCTET